METYRPLLKDADGEDVDEHLYRSMIGSLMYLTSSRLDIMFEVCACARFQVNPKISHLHAVKRIFRYLKDKKSTTGGCQFLGCRLISWQCKKQTMVANSTTEGEYVAALSCCGQIIHKGWLKWNVTAARDEIEVKTSNLRVNAVVHYLVLMGESLNFDDSHNMVAYMEKSIENADFAEIVDFLNANPISSKSTAWNEFGTNIASAVICLAKNQKFNFSKLIFDGMMRNLDSSKKFLMYPRFLQLFLNKQIENLSEVNVVYDTPSHTKKIFANMRRQGKDFSGTVTPLFSSMLAQQADMGEGSGQPTDPQHTSTSAQPSNEEPITVPSSSQPKKTHRPRKAKRATEISQSSRPIPLVADETITKEREDRMERAATTASSLEAEQDSGNINRTQSMATLNEPSPQGTSSGSGPRCQDTILGDAEAQTRFETASKQSNDPPLSRVNTLRSGEDRLKLKELMDLCTKLSDRVLDLETTKTAQAKEIASLKKRVKKLERKRKSKTPGMNLFKIGTSSRRSLGEKDAFKHGRNLKQGKQSSIFEGSDFDEEFDANMDEAIEQVYDANKDIVEEGEVQVPTADMEFNTASALVTTASVSVSFDEPITTASVNITAAEPTTPLIITVFEDEDLTIAQTLVKMRNKGKGKMVEQEKPLKKKDQIKFDEEIAQRLQAQMQAELEEEERLARERKEDANIVEWDDVQAMMDVDYELSARL
ncbi:hypothetical protein Tco_1172718 [Tanacetum coccineum]